MIRYATRASWSAFEDETLQTATIYDREPEEPRETGILDASGNMLWRLPEKRQPVGFFLKPRVRVKAGRG